MSPRTLAIAVAALLPPAFPIGARPACPDFHPRIVELSNLSLGPTPAIMFEMARVGNRLFVTGGNGDVMAVNISNPTQPSLIGHFTLLHTAVTMVTDGQTLFIGGTTFTNAYVSAVDVTTGANVLDTFNLSTVQLTTHMEQLTLDGNVLYVATLGDGLFALDVSNPGNIQPLGYYAPTFGDVTGAAISGNFAYVGRGSPSGLDVLDVTDPANPIQVGSLNVSAGARHSPVVDGSDVYMVDRGNTDLWRYDVSDPTQPVEDMGWGLDFGYRLRKSGDRLYVVGYSGVTGEIRVFDLTDMASGPIGKLRPYGGLDFVPADPYGYVSTYKGGLSTVEILDETTMMPTDISSQPLTYLVHEFRIHGTTAIQLEWSYDPVSNGAAWGFRTFNIVGTPPHPVSTGVVYLLGQTLIRADTRTDIAVATSTRGLEVARISPLPLAFLGRETISSAHDVALNGDYAYVSTDLGTVEVVDVSSPGLPTTVASVPIPGAGNRVVVSGDHLFVADGTDGLVVFDVSVPDAPVNVASGILPDGGDGLAVAGDRAYVKASASGNLYVVDVSSPGSPVILGSVTLQTGATLNLDEANGVVYAQFNEGGARHGFEIVDVTDPTSPFLVESIYDDPHALGSTVIVGSQIFSYYGNRMSGYPLACGAGAVDVPEPVESAAGYALQAAPNPFEESTVIRFGPRSGTSGAVGVYDVRGRLVRRLPAPASADRGVVRWDGRDASGIGVAPGVYFLRMEGERGAAPTTRVVRLN
jgi:hypothetical protein